MTLSRILIALHGYLGVLCAAALFHPAILLRRGKALSRGGRWSIGLTTAFTVAAFSLGVFMYEEYRNGVKRDMFRVSFPAGLLFETKEHLAFVILCLAIGSCIAVFTAPKESKRLRQAAAAAYLTASILAAVVSALGTYVTALHTFPE